MTNEQELVRGTACVQGQEKCENRDCCSAITKKGRPSQSKTFLILSGCPTPLRFRFPHRSTRRTWSFTRVVHLSEQQLFLKRIYCFRLMLMSMPPVLTMDSISVIQVSLRNRILKLVIVLVMLFLMEDPVCFLLNGTSMVDRYCRAL